MEAVGLAVGLVGLAGLFSTCVDCFKLVEVYQSRSEHFDHLQTMLDNQQFLFMAWGRACGFMDPDTQDERFDGASAQQRNRQIENTMKCIIKLLSDGEGLKRRYGMKLTTPGNRGALSQRPHASAFSRAFQGTKTFWNTSLQRRAYIAGTICWAVQDKEKFFDLVGDLRSFIGDLRALTDPLGLRIPQKLIVDYEMELIDDAQSLNAISAASPPAGGDDIVSQAASRQLARAQERSIAPSVLRPDDSTSIFSFSRDTHSAQSIGVNGEDDLNGANQEIGVHRVLTSQWRYVKTRQGFLFELPTLLVSMSDPWTSESEADARLGLSDPNDDDMDFLSPRDTTSSYADPAKCEGVALPRQSLPDRIAINSPTLLRALSKITGMRLNRNQNVLVYPFKLLLYHEQEIRDALDLTASKCAYDSTSSLDNAILDIDDTASTSANRTKGQDYVPYRLRDELKTLVELMDSDLEDIYRLRERIRAKTLLGISYNQLCLLFQPGDVIVSDSDCPRAYRVLAVTGGQKILDTENHSGTSAPTSVEPWEVAKVNLTAQGHIETSNSTTFFIDCFYLDSDGRKVGPRPQRFVIPEFINKRPIVLLPVYPLSFHATRNLKDRLRKRGVAFINAMKPQMLHHTGNALADLDVDHTPSCQYCRQRDTYELLDSRVMIDYNSTVEHLREVGCEWKICFGAGTLSKPTEIDRRENFEVVNCPKQGCTRCSDIVDDSILEIRRRAEYMNATDLLGESSIDILDDDWARLELLPFRVCGYAFTTRKWYSLNIEFIKPVVSEAYTLDRLVLPHGHKEVIRALLIEHSNSQPKMIPDFQDISGDLIPRKGQGLLMLFHGATGVGKSLTAEAVASHLNRPVFPVTCGDIWNNTKNVEKSLGSIMTLAQRWNCVLILKQADVFLTPRQKDEDLEKSILMSTFLRQLEYFSGILILTSNRVKQLDKSFRSRINISLFFPSLTLESATKIWEFNLKRVEDKERILVDTEQILDFAHGLHQKDDGWSGRQIRNAFQTAVALAKYEGLEEDGPPRLRVQYFQQVVEASQHFDEHLDEHFSPSPGASSSNTKTRQFQDSGPSTTKRESMASTKSISETSGSDRNDDDSIRELELRLELARLRKKKKRQR